MRYHVNVLMKKLKDNIYKVLNKRIAPSTIKQFNAMSLRSLKQQKPAQMRPMG